MRMYARSRKMGEDTERIVAYPYPNQKWRRAPHPTREHGVVERLGWETNSVMPVGWPTPGKLKSGCPIQALLGWDFAPSTPPHSRAQPIPPIPNAIFFPPTSQIISAQSLLLS